MSPLCFLTIRITHTIACKHNKTNNTRYPIFDDIVYLQNAGTFLIRVPLITWWTNVSGSRILMTTQSSLCVMTLGSCTSYSVQWTR